MAQGVKCDEPTCTAFAELPVDPAGGFQPLDGWIEIKTSSGRYHACGGEHASSIAKRAAATIEENKASEEDHARQLNDQATQVRGNAEVRSGQLQ